MTTTNDITNDITNDTTGDYPKNTDPYAAQFANGLEFGTDDEWMIWSGRPDNHGSFVYIVTDYVTFKIMTHAEIRLQVEVF